MDKKTLESLLNPVRLKILRTVLKMGQATAKELLIECIEIKQATLYRNINRLVQDNILEVIEENRIRGTVEKVYGIKENPFLEVREIVENNNKEAFIELFYNFSLITLKKMQNYIDNDKNELKDMFVGFRDFELYLTDDEAKEMVEEMKEVINKRKSNKNIEGRKLKSITTIFMESKEE